MDRPALQKLLADVEARRIDVIAVYKVDRLTRENMGGPYAARLIRLNHLAPDIVAAILDGKQPTNLTANKLMADTRLPLDWCAQLAALGFARR
jgi:DNA invertase Pin-like site-specific DNA recombinase